MKKQEITAFKKKAKKKGKAAKTKQSNNKDSKNYVKKYRGQG
jgi:hypothetical protein